MASKLDNHITLADHGPIRVREKGFAVANVASLGRCAVENRGAQYRVEGGAGVADVTYECMKDSADAYAWEIVTGGGGAFVEKSGDTMTGDLTVESAGSDLNLDTYIAALSATQSAINLRKSRSDTPGAQTVVVSSEQIGRISFYGSDGTNFEEAARIGALVDATPGNNDMPGRLVFYTTADGANSITERMRITSGGDVGIGKTPTTGVKLDVQGLVKQADPTDPTKQMTFALSGISAGTTRTLTVPNASGTLALVPTVTQRTNSTTVGTGATGSVSVTCSAGEVVTGGGCTIDTGSASTPLARSRVDASGWTCTYGNTSGATRTITAQAICMDFPS